MVAGEGLIASPTVSVVLPVYNGERFVQEAIRSIQEQTFSDWELVILDDGSSDSSLEICKKCEERDQRIRVYANGTNLGLAKTMNKLVRLAKGKYIAVQEQDDLSLPDRLRLEVDLLEANPEVGLVSGVSAWVDDKGQAFRYNPQDLYNGIPFPNDKKGMVELLYSRGCKVVNAACMLRKEILNEIPGPFDERVKIPDYQFFLHVAHKYAIQGIPQVLVKMRRDQEHCSFSANKKTRFSEDLQCVKIIYDIYKNDVNSPINFNCYRKKKSELLVWHGRYWGSFTGCYKLIQAICYDPFNKNAWKSLRELAIQGLKKIQHCLPIFKI